MPQKQHLPSVSDKEQRMYEHIKQNELQQGRPTKRAKAIAAATTHQQDFALPYVTDLKNVVDMEAIRGAGAELTVVSDGFGFYVHDVCDPHGIDVLTSTYAHVIAEYRGRGPIDPDAEIRAAREPLSSTSLASPVCPTAHVDL